MVAGPRNHFTIDKAGNQDSGLFFGATAGGLSIASHTVPKETVLRILSLDSGIEQCQKLRSSHSIRTPACHTESQNNVDTPK
jgi:hypothetical protein